MNRTVKRCLRAADKGVCFTGKWIGYGIAYAIILSIVYAFLGLWTGKWDHGFYWYDPFSLKMVLLYVLIGAFGFYGLRYR